MEAFSVKSLKSAARRGGIVSATVLSALALAACSAGQISQTADQVAAVDGAEAQTEDDTIALRDVTVLIDDSWTNAALKFVMINQDTTATMHHLVSATVDGQAVDIDATPELDRNCSLIGDSQQGLDESLQDEAAGCIFYTATSLPNNDFAVGGSLPVTFTFDNGSVTVEAAISHPTLESGTYDRPSERNEGAQDSEEH